jgi:hypothetical protein
MIVLSAPIRLTVVLIYENIDHAPVGGHLLQGG